MLILAISFKPLEIETTCICGIYAKLIMPLLNDTKDNPWTFFFFVFYAKNELILILLSAGYFDRKLCMHTLNKSSKPFQLTSFKVTNRKGRFLYIYCCGLVSHWPVEKNMSIIQLKSFWRDQRCELIKSFCRACASRWWSFIGWLLLTSYWFSKKKTLKVASTSGLKSLYFLVNYF